MQGFGNAPDKKRSWVLLAKLKREQTLYCDCEVERLILLIVNLTRLRIKRFGCAGSRCGNMRATMNRLISFFFAGGLLLCAPVVAQAAPLGGGLSETPVLGEALVTKTHGYHRSCRWGPHRGWWHRHLHNGRP